MGGKRKLAIATGVVLAGYGAFLASLWAVQDKLVFRGAQKSKNTMSGDAEHKSISRCVHLPSHDGTGIACFEMGDEDGETILVLPGNGGNAVGYMRWVSSQIRSFHPEKKFKLVSLHYRGYGLSEGTPKGADLVKDVMLVCSKYSPKAVFGRSLGAGLGAIAAARLDIPAVLVSPWDSLVSVAGDYTGASIPRFLLNRIFRHRVHPSKEANAAKSKLMVVTFSGDKTVRPLRSEKLFHAWAGEKEMRVLPGSHKEVISLTEKEVALLVSGL